jgi:quercetin dioxygenase-like cupin family protein
MQVNTMLKALAVACVGALLTGCKDKVTSPAMLAAQDAPAAAVANQILPDPFTVRGPLDPFFINQPSELMMRANERRDFAMQRLVTAPGAGAWHIHPGPSFGYVDQGEVMITRFTKKDGCVSTSYRPGDTYFEVAGEVHRATVVGTATAVEYKARFYTPVGAPFSTVVPAPDCTAG